MEWLVGFYFNFFTAYINIDVLIVNSVCAKMSIRSSLNTQTLVYHYPTTISNIVLQIVLNGLDKGLVSITI